ncbi:MAG: PcfB family protein [Lachnospiraceae bacterium]|nr:PcfB family protein [Lachnospiraceae bacterium]
MQEEVENKTVHLAIQTGKVTVKTLLRGLHAWYRHHQRKKDVAKMSGESVKGKQSVKELIGQGQGVSSMDIGDSGIKDFKKIANKYGVDFAIVKDKEADPARYTVFFKAKDADAITQILKEYAAKQTKKKEKAAEKKPSILQKLKKFKEKVASMPRRDKEKRKEREL